MIQILQHQRLLVRKGEQLQNCVRLGFRNPLGKTTKNFVFYRRTRGALIVERLVSKLL